MKRYIKSVNDFHSWVDDLCDMINAMQNAIFLKYAYIGIETYVIHSDDYNKMMNESTGVIKWIINQA